jgi:hypothetical protein
LIIDGDLKHMAIVRASAAPSAAPVRERPASTRPVAHPTREAAAVDSHVERVDSAPLTWQEPTNLDAPAPRQGFVQRWVRDLVAADSRDSNWAKRYAEGWRPREPETVGDTYRYMIGRSSGGQGVLRIGNNVLCEMRVEAAQQRAAFYRNKLEVQMRSAGADDMSAAAAAGRKVGMKPITSQVEDVRPGGTRVPPVMTD